MYFARRQEGDKSEMPHFAGQRGPEILRGLIEIEAVFDKNLSMLHDVKRMILDVKATTWHDDYNRSGQGSRVRFMPVLRLLFQRGTCHLFSVCRICILRARVQPTLDPYAGAFL